LPVNFKSSLETVEKVISEKWVEAESFA